MTSELDRLVTEAQRLRSLHRRTGATYAVDVATGSIDQVHPGVPQPSPVFKIPTPRRTPTSGKPRRARTAGSRGDPNEPPLDVIPPATFRRDLDRAVKARALLRWSRSLDQGAELRPWEKRRIDELSDAELSREVRGLNQVDRAIKRYRGAA